METTYEVKLTRDQVNGLNKLAQENFDKAQGKLEGINEILGTDYRWLNKRVVFLFRAHGQVEWHAAWAWAK